MKTILIVISICFFLGCNSSTVLVNDANDIKTAEKLTLNFYQAISHNQIDSITNKLSSNLSEDEIKKWIQDIKTLQGELIKIDITKTYTKSELSEFGKTFYSEVEIKATYEKGSSVEILNFKGENKIYIFGYSSKIQ
jgi:hypothetical protein